MNSSGQGAPSSLRGVVCNILMLLLLGSGCASPRAPYPVQAGSHWRAMEATWHGRHRGYLIDVPEAMDPSRPAPLIVALHGFTQDADSFRMQSAWTAVAGAEGAVVVYPEGIGVLNEWFRHWNGGFCCGKAQAINLDDAGHILGIIDEVAVHLPIDPSRVYLTGFSNGGMLALDLAARFPRRFAAVVGVGTTMGTNAPAPGKPASIHPPSAPVPCLLIHGTRDEKIPTLRENEKTNPRSVAEGFWSHETSLIFWQEHLRAFAYVPPRDTVEGPLRLRVWKGEEDRAELVSLRVAGWGHTWPGPAQTAALPDSSELKNLNLTRFAWWFMKRHVRPEEEKVMSYPPETP